jgi:accessory colonization factor AcfC
VSAPERPMELRAEIDRLRAENAKLRQDVGTLEVRGWQQRATEAERELIDAAITWFRWAETLYPNETLLPQAETMRYWSRRVLAERKEHGQ